MSEVQYAIAILKEKLGNADKHNLHYQRLSIADMEAIWGVLSKCESDYAELKAQRDALAAENAALKVLAESCSREYEGPNTEDCDDDEKVSYPEEKCNITFGMIRHALKTPATDAYLNSVRAEGIEILTGKLQQLIDEGTFDAKEIGVAAGTIHEGAQIAAQLRTGKDGE